jgi:hypothetical protein
LLLLHSQSVIRNYLRVTDVHSYQDPLFSADGKLVHIELSFMFFLAGIFLCWIYFCDDDLALYYYRLSQVAMFCFSVTEINDFMSSADRKLFFNQIFFLLGNEM